MNYAEWTKTLEGITKRGDLSLSEIHDISSRILLSRKHGIITEIEYWKLIEVTDQFHRDLIDKFKKGELRF